MKETDLNYESLEWFLNFLTLDLDTADTRKLTHFAQWHFLGQWSYFPFVNVKDYFEMDEDEVREKAQAMGYTESVNTKWPDKEILIEVQQNLRKVVDAQFLAENRYDRAIIGPVDANPLQGHAELVG